MKTTEAINKRLELIKKKAELETQIERELGLLKNDLNASFKKTKEKIEHEKNEN